MRSPTRRDSTSSAGLAQHRRRWPPHSTKKFGRCAKRCRWYRPPRPRSHQQSCARRCSAAAEPAQSRRQPRWRTAVFASAAAIAVGLGAFGLGVLTRPSASPTVAEQVLAAPDVQTVSGRLGGGTATVMFSRDRNAGVLVMNNVPPPSPGTVYQMWLVDAKGPTSAGTMGPTAVTPSTKATLTDLGDSTTLAFTVEPGTGSTKPTGTVLAELPLR
ncbi:anti-sigma factor [Mycobacterium ulcerans]